MNTKLVTRTQEFDSQGRLIRETVVTEYDAPLDVDCSIRAGGEPFKLSSRQMTILASGAH